MTTPNLDALAKRSPFRAMCGEVWPERGSQSLSAAELMAIANEWAELRKLVQHQPDGSIVIDADLATVRVDALDSQMALENAELRAYRERMAWQPIDTAPKDGTEILALCRAPARDGDYYEAVRYLTDAPCWVTREGWMRHPTHWMPLPAGPGQGAT
jgi:hypothetical protein